MDRRRKITWVGNTKVDISVFLIIGSRFFFVLGIQLLILHFPKISHCQGISRCEARFAEGVRVVGVEFVYPLRMKGGLRELILERQFMTPEGIACRLLGVWVISFTMYFNCFPFLLNTLNYRSPSGYQIIFMSRNRNLLFVTTWTLSSFVGREEVDSVVHISALNCRCFFPADLFTVFWNSSNQYLISFVLLFSLNTTRP